MEQVQRQQIPAAMGRWRRTLGLAAVAGGVFIAVLAIQAPSTGAFRIPILMLESRGDADPFGEWLRDAVFVGLVLASLPLWGKLSDVYGRRRLWLVGLLLFMAGSVGLEIVDELFPAQIQLAGLAKSLGTGAIVVLGPALIGDLYPPSERAKRLGVLVAALGLGLFGELAVQHALPQPVPEIKIQADVVYEIPRPIPPWPLYLVLPFSGLVAIASWFGLAAAREGVRNPVKVRGAAALAGAAIVLFLPVQLAWPRHGDLSGALEISVMLLAAAAVMLAVLWVVLRRAPEPIFDPRLLTNRAFLLASLLAFVVSVALTNAQHAAWLVSPRLGGRTIGTTNPLHFPEQIAAVVAFAVGAVVAGQFLGRTARSKRPILALLLIGTVGALLLTRPAVEATATERTLGLAVTALGLGGLVVLLIAVVQNGFPRRGLGEVTAGLCFFGALGAAVLAPFLPWPARSAMFDSLGRQLDHPSTNPPVLPDMLGVASLVAALLMAVGFVLALLLYEEPTQSVAASDAPTNPTLPNARDIPTIAERRRARD